MSDTKGKALPEKLRPFTRRTAEGEWQDVDVLKYKEGPETHFRSIDKRVLFPGHRDLPTELRYFEIAPGGYSTLERHEHLHVVMVTRGQGQALVGTNVYDLAVHDVVQVDAMTWHQFRAIGDEPFGFLCLVHVERDRPQLPDDLQVKELASTPELALFLRHTRHD